MSRFSRRVLAAFFSLVMVLGAAACGDDDNSSNNSSPSPTDASGDSGDTDTRGEPDTGGETDEEALDIEELTGGSDRPFDVSREDLAKSIGAGTSADRWEVEGETIYLFFDDGTYDSIRAAINCSAALTLQSDEDRVVLVYPDGEVDCNEQS